MISASMYTVAFYIGNLILAVGPMQMALALNGHLSHFHFRILICVHKIYNIYVYVKVHSNLNSVAKAIPMAIIHFI